MHSANSFLTLTYDDDHCPRSLEVRDLQLFFKRLRKKLEPQKIRYFACGEYGEKLGRPHYHVLLFGYEFPDKKKWAASDVAPTYKSEQLTKLWPSGSHLIGTVTTASAQYVSKYCTKIIKGERAEAHYEGRTTEFAIMSRNPGIGHGWIKQFRNSIFPRDFVVVEGGAKVAVPRYYLALEEDWVQKRIKASRAEAMKDDPEARGSRSIIKARLKTLQLERAQRRYENEASSIQHLRLKSGVI